MQSVLTLSLAFQTIQGAVKIGGSDLMRNVAVNATSLPEADLRGVLDSTMRRSRNKVVRRRIASNAAGLPEESLSRTQDSATHTHQKYIVRKVAINAAVLPNEQPKATQDTIRHARGNNVVRKVAINAAGFADDSFKGARGSTRRAVSVGSAGNMEDMSPVRKIDSGMMRSVAITVSKRAEHVLGPAIFKRESQTNAALVDNNQRGNGLSVEISLSSEAIRTVSSRSQLRNDTSTVNLVELSTATPTRAARPVTVASAGERTIPAYNAQEGSIIRSSAVAQFRNGSVTMSVISQKIGFSTFVVLLIVLVLPVLAFFGITWHMLTLRIRQRQQDRAMLALRTAAQNAVQHVLCQEHGDWRNSFTKLHEFQDGNFSKSHPLYHAMDSHMDESGIRTQLQGLFSHLSEGEDYVTAEQLNYMFAHFYVAITNLTTGCLVMNPCIAPTASYAWLMDLIDQPLTCSMFVSIFVLYMLYVCHTSIIQSVGDSSTQVGQACQKCKVEYHVEIRGRVACRASFSYGTFRRPGAFGLMGSSVRNLSSSRRTCLVG